MDSILVWFSLNEKVQKNLLSNVEENVMGKERQGGNLIKASERFAEDWDTYFQESKGTVPNFQIMLQNECQPE